MITGFNLVLFLVGFAMLYCIQLIFNRSIFLKILAITYLFLVSSAVFFSFDTYKGWPSSLKQTKGVLIYALVIEPAPNREGSIYLWIVPEKKKTPTLTEKLITYDYQYNPAPRSFRLKYNSKLSSDVNSAIEKIQNGQVVVVEMSDGENGDASLDSKSDNGQKGKSKNKGDAEDYERLKINIIPPQEIFKKE